ncbi:MULTISPECIES: diaminopimelate epimerase [Lentibacillus]|uniref:Diaminopimelate epimerase n=1 Tax=Lentibacillus cibarius TaxID=2583219 RepID=A0A5S3QH96_9BACI|nr:hypothetical protein [Lentibacillus cibarius]TMN21255.1 hypothetical protein FFL34_03370 [Lentibacillus cibarius]
MGLFYSHDGVGLPELAKSVSHIHTGIGSDGLILIHPSEDADVGMRIFNKDGSEGKNCGNGLAASPNTLITQGCGTGACAAVVAATLNGEIAREEEVTVHLDGGDLHIHWQQDGDVLMTGGAETIAAGIYHFIMSESIKLDDLP